MQASVLEAKCTLLLFLSKTQGEKTLGKKSGEQGPSKPNHADSAV
jgi:hypothetical protein